MRAFRPSHFVPNEGAEEDKERAKQANVLRYSQRVAAGLPLFETLAVTESKGVIPQVVIPGRN